LHWMVGACLGLSIPCHYHAPWLMGWDEPHKSIAPDETPEFDQHGSCSKHPRTTPSDICIW
jgi:hypothetical protein